MHEPETGESRDGTGSGDRNCEFSFGNPGSCLTWVQRAHLLVMRGYVMDFRAGATGGAADGDVEPPTPDPPAVLDIGQYWLDDT